MSVPLWLAASVGAVAVKVVKAVKLEMKNAK